MLRRYAVAAALGLLGAILAGPSDAQSADKQLVRVRGTVEYQGPAQPALQPLFGHIDLPDDALGVTLARSQATLRMADSSEIDVGERARFRVGAFNAIGSGKPTVVTLELGALHFVVRHPQGSLSNYRFVTSTTQIAVRGTEGYIVAGPTGTDFYCVACRPGDVTVTVGRRSYVLSTGYQAIVVGGTAATARTTVVKQPCGNPAAIALSGGKLGRTIPPAQRVDTTGALGANPLAVRATTTPR